ncbi:MAG: hypothetical protein HZB50_16255 [Chloroflexi bacterium]|nr:hypothetical protein [Chloroflexota bacterium]
MNFLLNQYSFIIASIFLILVAGLILLRNQPKLKDFLAFGMIVMGFVIAWVMLHPHQTPLMGNAKAVSEMIGNGTPVLLEFQSPY